MVRANAKRNLDDALEATIAHQTYLLGSFNGIIQVKLTRGVYETAEQAREALVNAREERPFLQR